MEPDIRIIKVVSGWMYAASPVNASCVPDFPQPVKSSSIAQQTGRDAVKYQTGATITLVPLFLEYWVDLLRKRNNISKGGKGNAIERQVCVSAIAAGVLYILGKVKIF